MRLEFVAVVAAALCAVGRATDSTDTVDPQNNWTFSTGNTYLSPFRLDNSNVIIPMAYHNQRILRIIPAGARRHAKNGEDEKAFRPCFDESENILQYFNLNPSLVDQKIGFGPKRCPIYSFDVVQNRNCEFDGFSSCGNRPACCPSTSSSSSTCESWHNRESSTSSSSGFRPDSGCEFNEDPTVRLLAGCSRVAGFYQYPSLKKICCFPHENILTVRVAPESGRSYILTTKEVIIIDCKCERVKRIKHFYFNGQTMDGVDLIVNETSGILLLGLTSPTTWYGVVYRLCDFNVIWEAPLPPNPICVGTKSASRNAKSGHAETATKEALNPPFRFEYSASQPVPDREWIVYFIIDGGIDGDLAQSTAVLAVPVVRTPNLVPGCFPSVLALGIEGCMAGNFPNPLVINDYMNKADIFIQDQGGKLNIFVFQFFWCDITTCTQISCNLPLESFLPIPPCISGTLANRYGVKLNYTNEIYLTFVPSLDMLTLTYDVAPITTKKKACPKKLESAIENAV